jgi:hypothetical protein
MIGNWASERCERPDPYLEWEHRTRVVDDSEHWCSVQIQVRRTHEGLFLPNLCRLRDAVQAGSLPEDHVSAGTYTIRMSDDERTLLDDWINRLGGRSMSTTQASHEEEDKERQVDDIDMQFFIYRGERYIYRGGEYHDPDFYRSLFSGPPIVGLAFNEFNPQPEPTFVRSFLQPHEPIIGIIDDEIAFAHERFRSGPKSRIKSIWLQDTERRDKNDGVCFGRRLKGDEIEHFFKRGMSEDRIYRAVGVTDFGRREYNPLAARATHGTHVLDLASGAPGEFPLLAVQLPSQATIDTSGVTMGSYVLQAVRTIMLWADQIGHKGRSDKEKVGSPLVINFSYGLLAGPKDGTQVLERLLADLIHHRNRRAPTRLVMPAGNSYRTRAAARLDLYQNHERKLDWVILPDDGATNYVEIWLDGGAGNDGYAPIEVSLTPQDEPDATPLRPRLNHVLQYVVKNKPVAGVYYQVFDRTGPRERVLLAVNPTVRNDDRRALAPAGRWKLSIKSFAEHRIKAHIYVQRDDTPFGYPNRGRQSYLDHPDAYRRDPQTGDYWEQAPGCPIIYQETLSSIATGSADAPDHAIVVGAAEATDGHPPADYTSSGPTLVRAGPDCSAFADEGDAHRGVLAAGTFSGSVVAMRGTSVAAPQIARQIASKLAADRSRHAPTDEPGETVIIVHEKQAPRLGKYIYLPPRDARIPRRRYPAVEELEPHKS